jgi:hypothetical protein
VRGSEIEHKKVNRRKTEKFEGGVAYAEKAWTPQDLLEWKSVEENYVGFTSSASCRVWGHITGGYEMSPYNPLKEGSKHSLICCLLQAGFLSDLFFYPEDGSNIFLRNVTKWVTWRHIPETWLFFRSVVFHTQNYASRVKKWPLCLNKTKPWRRMGEGRHSPMCS